jgi:hypothetical protein
MTPPAPLKPWQWTRAELQAQLTVGTILMTDDCACFAVTGITPEGVISPWPPGYGHHLLTWDYLEQKECVTFGHVNDEPGLSAGPVLRERGGWLDDRARTLDDDQRLDLAAIAAMRRLLPDGTDKGILTAERARDGGDLRVILTGGADAAIPVDDELRHAAAAIFDRTAAMQHRPADGLILLLVHRPQGWWYDLEFTYR